MQLLGNPHLLKGDTEMLVLEDLKQEWQNQKKRAVRHDLARSSARQEARKEMCQGCKKFSCDEFCQSWQGLHAAMLCIGLDEYLHISKLPNAMRDAHALQEQANAVPQCKAEILENPCTAVDMTIGIKKFLNLDGLKKSPPEVVLIVYCCQGMQQGTVYLLPIVLLFIGSEM